MLFKLPVVLATALLTLGASASERFTVTSLRRRDQPGDYPQDVGRFVSPQDGQVIEVNDRFLVQFNPITLGDEIKTSAIKVEIEIPEFNYKRRLATNLMSLAPNTAIEERFFFLKPRGLSEKSIRGKSFPGLVTAYELQAGTKRNGGGLYFLNESKNVTFQF